MPTLNAFGRKSAPDSRDSLFLMRRLRPTLVWRLWRYYTMPREMPLDQGQTGTCVGHAWLGWLIGAPLMSKMAALLSAFEYYRKFILRDPWTQNDYEATLPDLQLQWGTSVRAGAEELVEQGHVKTYLWAFSAQDCADWILSDQGTIVMGTDWTEGMSSPDQKGVIRVTGSLLGGHAWLLIGYNRVTGFFTGMNSWGPTFGKNGRFKLHFDELQKLFDAGGEGCTATQQKLSPV
jgi:hypothetical protein